MEIYLDYAATTPVFPEAVREAEKAMIKDFGNPSSIHKKGENALKIINDARIKIAREIGCKPSEIIFTSGATESNNLALGLKWRKILISAIEHPSVMVPAKESDAVEISVDKSGLINLEELERKVGKGDLVSIMHVNNIFGTIQDLEAIAKICRKKGAIFHTDAVQSFGKLKIDVRKGIDLLSASAHKIGGIKGTGFLYVREGLKINPLIKGSGQERGTRSGTENVPGIAAFAKALEVQKKENTGRIRRLRDKLIRNLESLGGKINGDKEKRIWNNVHVSFPGNDNEGIVIALSMKGIYLSTGSACESKKAKEDYILKAIGLKKEEIDSGIRITLGHATKEKDITELLKELRKILR